jgi:hypothetical protein
MHFLKEIIKNPILENPAKDHMNIHRHFVKYSRGEFTGPGIKLKKYSTKIVLKGSLEYEDIVQEIVTRTVSKEYIAVEGKIIARRDITDTLNDLDLDWQVKENTGKSKGFKTKFSETLSKEKLLEIIQELRKDCYLILNFKIDKYCQIKTDEKLPKPSKKNPIEDDIDKRVSFSRGYVKTNKQNLDLVYEHILPDFKSELPDDWTDIILTNTYQINDIEIPKDAKNSRMMRINAIRKGKLVRTVKIDEKIIKKKYSIKV